MKGLDEMAPEVENFLRCVIKESGVDFPSRHTAGNPLDNSYWANLVDGALTALEVVAIGSLDWKLTAIVKLFQSWLKDKRAEKQELKTKTEFGYNYEQVGGGQASPDDWSRTYY